MNNLEAVPRAHRSAALGDPAARAAFHRSNLFVLPDSGSKYSCTMSGVP